MRKVAGSVNGGDWVCRSISRRGNSMHEVSWYEEAWEGVRSIAEGDAIFKALCKIKI